MAKDAPETKRKSAKRKRKTNKPLSDKQKALAKMLEGIARSVRRRSR